MYYVYKQENVVYGLQCEQEKLKKMSYTDCNGSKKN